MDNECWFSIERPLSEFILGYDDCLVFEGEGKQEITMDDLIFLEEELVKVIGVDFSKNFTSKASVGVGSFIPSPTASPSPSPSPSPSLQKNETLSNKNFLNAEEKTVIWKEVNNKLADLDAKKKTNGKMKTIYSALRIILDAIQKIDEDFDPMGEMPGNVSDFYDFCLNLPYGPNIFPKKDIKTSSKKSTFHSYCKGKIKIGKEKRTALCVWGSKPTSDQKFWGSIKDPF